MTGPFLFGILGLFLHAEAHETPHPMSFSRLELRADSEGVHVDLRVQVLSLLEVTDLGLDVNANLVLTDEELRRGKPGLLEYLREGLVLVADGEALTPDFREFERKHEDFDWIFVQAQIPWSQLPDALLVSSTLFFDHGNPDHRMHITLHGVQSVAQFSLLDTERRTASFAKHPFQDYLRLGAFHVLEGWDHLAFLLALILGVTRVLGLVAAITGFTLAHSITLALSALDLFSLAPSIVEPGIALSILIVLGFHLQGSSSRVLPWKLAFGFGLLHGFGFAGVLGEIGLPMHARAEALFGFNLGVELGQLAFVLPVAAVASLGARCGAKTRASMRRNSMFVLGAAGLCFFANAVNPILPEVPQFGLWAAASLASLAFGLLPFLPHSVRPDWKLFVASSASLFLLYELGQWLAAR